MPRTAQRGRLRPGRAVFEYTGPALPPDISSILTALPEQVEYIMGHLFPSQQSQSQPQSSGGPPAGCNQQQCFTFEELAGWASDISKVTCMLKDGARPTGSSFQQRRLASRLSAAILQLHGGAVQLALLRLAAIGVRFRYQYNREEGSRFWLDSGSVGLALPQSDLTEPSRGPQPCSQASDQDRAQRELYTSSCDSTPDADVTSSVANGGGAGACVQTLGMFFQIASAGCFLVAYLLDCFTTLMCRPEDEQLERVQLSQTAARAAEFAHALLRTDVVAACARQLAATDAAEPYLPAAILARLGGGELTGRAVAFQAPTIAVLLIDSLARFATEEGKAGLGRGHGPSSSRVRPAGDKSVADALLQRLQGSSVLDHAARLLLRRLLTVARVKPPPQEPPAKLQESVTGLSELQAVELERELQRMMRALPSALHNIKIYIALYCSLRHFFPSGKPAGPPRRPLSCPDAHHVVLLLGISVLRCLDGGPTYDLPDEVVAAMEPLTEPIRRMGGGGGAAAAAAPSPAGSSVAAGQDTPAGTGKGGEEFEDETGIMAAKLLLPILPTAVFNSTDAGWLSSWSGTALLCRLARLGISPLGSDEGDRQEHPFLAQWSTEEGLYVTIRSVQYAGDLLKAAVAGDGLAGWLTGPLALRLQKSMAAWWRVGLELVEREMRGSDMSREHSVSLGRALAWTFPHFVGFALPAVPPVAILGAVRGELTRSLGTLVSKLTDILSDPPVGVSVLFGLVEELFRPGQPTCWRFLAPLLAYDDPQAAEALVASTGAVLRRLAAKKKDWLMFEDVQPVLLLAADVVLGGSLALSAEPNVAAAEARLKAATAPELAAVEEEPAAGAEHAAAGAGAAVEKEPAAGARPAARGKAFDAVSTSSPPSEQLGSMLTYAACQWLPPLLHILGMSKWMACRADCDCMIGKILSRSASAALMWLQIAASSALCQPDEENSSGREGSDGSGGAGAAVYGPRQWLLRDVDAWGLLRDVSALRDHYQAGEVVCEFARTCVLLAAALPEQLREATVKAAEAAKAEPGPSGSKRTGRTKPAASRRATGAKGASAAAPTWAPPSSLPPEMLRDILPELQRQGKTQLVSLMEGLARQLEEWAAGGPQAATDADLMDRLRTAAALLVKLRGAPVAPRLLQLPVAARRVVSDALP